MRLARFRLGGRECADLVTRFGFGKNHCLCHGDLGNLDILLHAAQRVDDSWWSEAGKRLASETLVGIAERGCLCGTQTSLVSPGLMDGLAGIGYGLLRLACPERVPSVLVLAPLVLLPKSAGGTSNLLTL